MISKKYKDIFLYNGHIDTWPFRHNFSKNSLYIIINQDYHHDLKRLAHIDGYGRGGLVLPSELNKYFTKINSKSSKLLFMDKL